MKCRALILVLLQSGITGVAFAATFSDVPETHLYKQQIDALVSAGVISGNPDGTFRPGSAVNRAEFLKLLYRAKGIIPSAASRGCFSDVPKGSWFESYVCDAAANHYVQGYGDGTFRPGNLVNRVEALKMITLVFGIIVDELSQSDRASLKFVDISTQAWYMKYLFAAFEKGILPIAGQEGTYFYPEKSLLRGEAAAYIVNALNVQMNDEQDEEEQGEEETSQEENGSDTPPEEQPTIVQVNLPFEDSATFSQKDSYSYEFNLTKSMVVLTTVSLQSGQTGSVSCRLYLLNESGFSHQYYLGYQEGTSCYLLAALVPGNYHLQLQPTVADTTFNVTSVQSTGDGNDGFMQAEVIKKGDTRTDILSANTFQDWYKFTVTTQTTMKVSVSDSTELHCIVYAMEDVQLYGFSGPECGQSFLFPEGTYYISVGRKKSKVSTQTYTVQLQ